MYVNEETFRVLYAHTDKAGVAYYGKYLEFFELGRAEHLRALGRSYAEFEQDGILLTVVEAHLRFLKPACYDDLLTVRSWVSRVRRTRVDYSYQVVNSSGQTLCEGSTVLGCLDGETRRPRALPQRLLDVLKSR